MAFMKKTSLRERILEEQRRQKEAEAGQKYKQRLIRVNISTKPYSLLHGMHIFYCGYCGKQMSLYSNAPIQSGMRLPSLFYACRDRCPTSGYHRTEFIDRLLMQLIQSRIVDTFQIPDENILKRFGELDEMHSQYLELLNRLHYASYKRDSILQEIQVIKNGIESFEKEIKSSFSQDADDNPLMLPLFRIAPADVNNLDLAYRRELVRVTTIRVRFFNEFIIVRMHPFTEEDEAKSDEMGRLFNINLRITDRGERIELPASEVMAGAETPAT
jgi:hypothetical protein